MVVYVALFFIFSFSFHYGSFFEFLRIIYKYTFKVLFSPDVAVVGLSAQHNQDEVNLNIYLFIMFRFLCSYVVDVSYFLGKSNVNINMYEYNSKLVEWFMVRARDMVQINMLYS